MLAYRLVFITYFISFCGCSSSQDIKKSVHSKIEEKKYSVELTTTPFIEAISIIFLDSTSIMPSKPIDFKRYYKPVEEDIKWVGHIINSSQRGDLRMLHLKKSILQYAGYETIEGQIKVCVGVLSKKYFLSHKDWCLQKHVFFDLVVNTGGKSKYQLYSIILNKPQGDFKIEIINK